METSPTPDFGSPHVIAHISDHVLHLRIDRPERRNAFTQDMYRAIKRAAVWSDRATDLDAVCITGTEGWFGAGGDLARRAIDGVTGLEEEWDGTDHFPFRHIERSRKIWVAKVNGVCHAGGVDLCLHCDITIASDQARFRLPELLRGLPDPMMAARLVATVGLAKARYMIFTASELTAAQAESIGLVGAVVAHDDLDATVEWALQQVRLTGPGARALLKREINGRLPAHDMTMFARLPTEEMVEGMASFVEKRDPVWRSE
jgi:enoyl-CoA hydratase